LFGLRQTLTRGLANGSFRLFYLVVDFLIQFFKLRLCFFGLKSSLLRTFEKVVCLPSFRLFS